LVGILGGVVPVELLVGDDVVEVFSDSLWLPAGWHSNCDQLGPVVGRPEHFLVVLEDESPLLAVLAESQGQPHLVNGESVVGCDGAEGQGPEDLEFASLAVEREQSQVVHEGVVELPLLYDQGAGQIGGGA